MDADIPHIELELKLEFDRADRPRLLHAPALREASGERHHLVSTYFDTPDGAVRRAGYGLRVRRHGTRRVQTVKAGDGAAAGLSARGEWERAIPGDEPVLDAASGPLLPAIGSAAAGRLAPAFIVDLERHTRQVLFAGADVDAAIDVGLVRAGDGVTHLCELELEWRGGPTRALFDLARQLDGIVPLRLGVRTKAERGYGLLKGGDLGARKAEAVPLEPDMAAADAFVAVAHGCLRHFRLNEAVLLGGYAPEALHQARVALRRLRSAMAVFEALFGDDEDAALLDAQLRRVTVVLGEARNLDVLRKRLGRRSAHALEEAARRARERVEAELHSARTRLLLLDVVEWLSCGRWRSEPGDPAALAEPVSAFAGAALGTARRRLVRAGRHFASLEGRRLHKVRIKAKKARYAAEFFASLWNGPNADRRHKAWLRQIEALQDSLGELNDLATGRALLAELGIASETALDADEAHVAALRGDAQDAFRALVRRKPFWRD